MRLTSESRSRRGLWTSSRVVLLAHPLLERRGLERQRLTVERVSSPRVLFPTSGFGGAPSSSARSARSPALAPTSVSQPAPSLSSHSGKEGAAHSFVRSLHSLVGNECGPPLARGCAQLRTGPWSGPRPVPAAGSRDPASWLWARLCRVTRGLLVSSPSPASVRSGNLCCPMALAENSSDHSEPSAIPRCLDEPQLPPRCSGAEPGSATEQSAVVSPRAAGPPPGGLPALSAPGHHSLFKPHPSRHLLREDFSECFHETPRVSGLCSELFSAPGLRLPGVLSCVLQCPLPSGGKTAPVSLAVETGQSGTQPGADHLGPCPFVSRDKAHGPRCTEASTMAPASEEREKLHLLVDRRGAGGQAQICPPIRDPGWGFKG